MNKKEQKLFFLLADFKSADKTKISKLIEKNCTAELLGTLFENRLAGVAYETLKNCELLGKVNREFRNSLKNARHFNAIQNEDFIGCVDYVAEQLNATGIKYALLKGAYLCKKYPSGLRTSNDIDVLLSPSDVGRAGVKLKAAGFRQGYIMNDTFHPATREEIIASKMSRGETVPYIKEIKLPFIKFLEVDLNFSLDYKNSDPEVLEKMLGRTVSKKAGRTSYMTLDKSDFFLHLCCHLHKEATTYPWIEMRRDMTLYKYLDIMFLLDNMSAEEVISLTERAGENKMEAELAYAVTSAAALFGDSENSDSIKKQISADLDYVINPEQKKTFRYTEKDIIKRFFAKDRTKLLEEAESNEKA